ncbi:MAG: hypothetical protein KBF28_06370 [Gemmatimonadales bacterium]|nr:hypothetical protein [Gemmatimonadales bacterium]
MTEPRIPSAVAPPRTTPELSVVVTVVEGGDAVRRILAALCQQQHAPAMEILLPIDDSVRELLALGPAFPAVRFLDLGPVTTAHPITSADGQHELYDRRRAAALAAATGDIVAILEDRGVPRPDWARTVVRLHALPWAVIGGAIEPAPSGLIAWALCACDFSRYALPFTAGPVEWVSDVNVSYKRRALDATRALWIDRFHEPAVHWELLRQGEVLYLSPEMVIDHHRTSGSFLGSLAERFYWGRLFGYIRAGQLGIGKRLVLGSSWPLVPLVLWGRQARVYARRGELGRFVVASPVMLGFLIAWALGEAIGTLTGRP